MSTDPTQPNPLDTQQLIVEGVGEVIEAPIYTKPLREFVWVRDYRGEQVHVIV